MPATGDAGMLERLERVETKIDTLETRFDHVETRFDHLETRFDGLTTEVVAVETRLSDRIDAQGRKFDVQFEQVRDQMKTFAEGLGGRLDAIVLELQESRKNTNDRFLDHDLALRDHGRRITALEQSRAE